MRKTHPCPDIPKPPLDIFLYLITPKDIFVGSAIVKDVQSKEFLQRTGDDEKTLTPLMNL
jgi:hypothetical protein